MLILLLYADDSVLMIETIQGLWPMFSKWKDAFENMDFKINLGKTIAMVRRIITSDGLYISRVYPCAICVWMLKVNSALRIKNVNAFIIDVR